MHWPYRLHLRPKYAGLSSFLRKGAEASGGAQQCAPPFFL